MGGADRRIRRDGNAGPAGVHHCRGMTRIDRHRLEALPPHQPALSGEPRAEMGDTPQDEALRQGMTGAVLTAQIPGPWGQAFWVDVPLSLRSKSNFRRGAGRGEWARQRSFSEDLARIVRAAVPVDWELGSFDAALKDRPVVVAVIVARSVLDAGNFSKSVLDACEGVVFHNDASVLHSGAYGERGRTDQRIMLGFARLESGASLDQLVAAASALSMASVAAYRTATNDTKDS